MSVVLTSDLIYQQFYADHLDKAFLHSHTYSGNALAASIALETLKIFEEENICAQVHALEPLLRQSMSKVVAHTGRLKNLRSIGAVVAADLCTQIPQKGFEVFQHAVALGAFLRPLGNTLYWLPPLNVEEEVLSSLTDMTIRAIENSFKGSDEKKVV